MRPPSSFETRPSRAPRDEAEERHDPKVTVEEMPGLVPGFFYPRHALSFVVAGLVPASPLRYALHCPPDRDRRDKPGDDNFSRMANP